MTGPADATKHIESTVRVDMAPTPLLDLIVAAIAAANLHTALPPEEQAEKWVPSVKSQLRQRIQGAREEARFLRVTLNPANDDYLQGSCFVEPADDEAVASAKNRRATLLRYVGEFEAIDPNTFERLCARTLSLFQVEEEFVTRASADQGVDFFGRVPFGEIIKPAIIEAGAERLLKVWLVGQAKHYKASQVSTKDIRELVGSVALAQSKVYSGTRDPLAELEIRICDPVVYLFFTTGTISRAAREVLTRSGVVAMDGLQLAMFLADHGVGLNGAEFDAASFAEWLSRKSP